MFISEIGSIKARGRKTSLEGAEYYVKVAPKSGKGGREEVNRSQSKGRLCHTKTGRGVRVRTGEEKVRQRSLTGITDGGQGVGQKGDRGQRGQRTRGAKSIKKLMVNREGITTGEMKNL